MAIPKKLPLSQYVGRRPSAFHWLEREYARVLGRIEQLERDLELGRAELSRLRQDLSHLTFVLQSDRVAAEPDDVAPIRPQRVQRALPYGAMTRHTLACLRKAGREVTTPEVVQYVMDKSGLILTHEELVIFSELIGKRLKALAYRGLVTRLHQGRTGRHGIWKLA